MQLQYWLHMRSSDPPTRCTKERDVAEQGRINHVWPSGPTIVCDGVVWGETGVHNKVELRKYASVVSLFLPTETRHSFTQ